MATGSSERTQLAISLAESPDAGGVVVSLFGELDVATSAQLQRCLDDLIEATALQTVVIDCRRLAFCDSSGLSVLVRLATRLGGAGSVTLRRPQSSLRRLLELTALTSVFALSDA